MYENLINHPYKGVTKHQRMKRENRAPQFAPFQAMSGLEGQMAEEARLTDKKPVLTDEEIDALNKTLSSLKPKDEILVTYFIPDGKKQGGSIASVTQLFREFNPEDSTLVFQDKTKISMENVLYILEKSTFY